MEFLAPESIDQLFQFALIVNGRRSVALELMAETISEVEARASQWREQSHILQWALRWCWIQSQRQPAADPSGSDLGSEMEAFLGCAQRVERAARGLICMSILEPSGIARVLELRVARVKELLVQVESQFAVDQHLEMRLKDCLSTMSINSLEKHLLGSAVRSAPRVRNRFERVLGVFAVLTGALVFLGWFGWERWMESEPVQVQASMGELVVSSGPWTEAGWKIFEGLPGEIDDWLFISGLEGARMSARLSGIRPAGGRILKWRDSTVAQLALPDAAGFLWVVHRDAVGIGSGAGTSGRLNASAWHGEWFADGRYAFLLAAPDVAATHKP
jgi:hypothetical protein